MEAKLEQATKPIEEVLAKLSPDAVFGAPIQEGAVTIIPVATVSGGFGYGFGYGYSAAEAEDENADEGGGGGGGGFGAAPVGWIEITPAGVSFQPIQDETRLALAGMTLVGWSLLWIAGAIRALARANARR